MRAGDTGWKAAGDVVVGGVVSFGVACGVVGVLPVAILSFWVG